MKILLKKALEELQGFPDQLETDILMLETKHDQDALCRTFKALYTFVWFADFFLLPSLKKCLNLVLVMVTEIRSQSTRPAAEDIDLLLLFSSSMRLLIEELQGETGTNTKSQGLEKTVVKATTEVTVQLESRLGSLAESSEPEPAKKVYPEVSIDLFKHITWPPDIKGFFLAEAKDRLASLEENIIALEGKAGLGEIYREISRHLHSLKGNAGTLIAILPSDELIRHSHPLKFFHDLVHESEDLVVRASVESKGISRHEIDHLLQILDELKSLLPGIEEDIPCTPERQRELDELKSLIFREDPADSDHSDISISDLSPRKRAFLNTAEQCLESMRQSIGQNSIDWSEGLPVSYVRAVKTLHKAAGKIGQPAVQAIVQELFDQLDDSTVIDSSVVATLIDQLHIELSDMRRETRNPTVTDNTVGTGPGAGTGETATRVSLNDTYVRVPQIQVDRIMNLVGELIVTKNAFNLLGAQLSSEFNLPNMADKAAKSGNEVGRITDALQAEIMDIRMVPLKTVFSRFPRLIRDLSKMTGKSLKLKIEGGETQLDKTIIEQLIDPLTHLLRNCADHGIELPSERAAAGKSRDGTLSVSAQRNGQFVVLQISDDGRGLNHSKIGARAIKTGVIQADEVNVMDNQAICSLIFRPGFSTADQVTEVSGRGVGLDVVQTTLNKLGGTVSIESRNGEGTRFTLKIPLTLAVTRGLMVEAGRSRFILPLENVEEIVKTSTRNIRQFDPHHSLFEHRNRVMPVIDLQHVLGLEPVKPGHASPIKNGRDPDTSDISCMAIVSDAEHQFALLVSGIQEEVEILYKSLGSYFSQLSGISGATILGDGKIVLILNPAGLLAI